MAGNGEGAFRVRAGHGFLTGMKIVLIFIEIIHAGIILCIRQ